MDSQDFKEKRFLTNFALKFNWILLILRNEYFLVESKNYISECNILRTLRRRLLCNILGLLDWQYGENLNSHLRDTPVYIVA